MNSFLYETILISTFFLGSFLLSTLLIRFFIRTPKTTTEGTADSKRRIWIKDTGFWIGFFEHIIIFIFVANREFSALAIIFGAKEFVRKDAIAKNPAYYLLGTLLNFGIALLAIELYLKLFTC